MILKQMRSSRCNKDHSTTIPKSNKLAKAPLATHGTGNRDSPWTFIKIKRRDILNHLIDPTSLTA